MFTLRIFLPLVILVGEWASCASMGVKDDRKLLASKSIGDNSLPIGYVSRLAARKFDDENSRPSSRFYTTRKDEQKEGIWVSKAGIRGDYNHYRTIALKGIPDRAVSLLTTDAMELLRSYGYPATDGDLGENILLDKVCYSFFEPGMQYRLKCSENEVVLEITEPVIPCVNLCKLPYINNDSKTPKERIKGCQEFISLLDSKPGLRGWYAKVIKEGAIVPESVLTQVL